MQCVGLNFSGLCHLRIMLWEIEIYQAAHSVDREAARVADQCRALRLSSIREVRAARSFILQGNLSPAQIEKIAAGFLADTVVETYSVHTLQTDSPPIPNSALRTPHSLLNVLYKPGVTDNVADSVKAALVELEYNVTAVRTCQQYWFNADAAEIELKGIAGKVVANDAIQQVVWGPLYLANLALGSEYKFHLLTVPIRGMSDEQLMQLSRAGQLFLNLPEMQTIRQHF